MLSGSSIYTRHHLLLKADIGVTETEKYSYWVATQAMWVAPLVVCLSSFLEFGLMWAYQTKFHPWGDILVRKVATHKHTQTDSTSTPTQTDSMNTKIDSMSTQTDSMSTQTDSTLTQTDSTPTQTDSTLTQTDSMNTQTDSTLTQKDSTPTHTHTQTDSTGWTQKPKKQEEANHGEFDKRGMDQV